MKPYDYSQCHLLEIKQAYFAAKQSPIVIGGQQQDHHSYRCMKSLTCANRPSGDRQEASFCDRPCAEDAMGSAAPQPDKLDTASSRPNRQRCRWTTGRAMAMRLSASQSPTVAGILNSSDEQIDISNSHPFDDELLGKISELHQNCRDWLQNRSKRTSVLSCLILPSVAEPLTCITGIR